MAVKEGLLALMREQPRYGYELKTEFESATGGVWTLNVGQVYTTLDRLERDGLVEVSLVDDPEGGASQKHYSLTNPGIDALTAWWQETPSSEPARDELIVKVLMAIRQSRSVALDVITRQRTSLTEAMLRHRRDVRRAVVGTDDSASDQLAVRLVADALITRSEANLRWLDQCEAQVLAAPAGAFATGAEVRL